MIDPEKKLFLSAPGTAQKKFVPKYELFLLL